MFVLALLLLFLFFLKNFQINLFYKKLFQTSYFLKIFNLLFLFYNLKIVNLFHDYINSIFITLFSLEIYVFIFEMVIFHVLILTNHIHFNFYLIY